MTSDDFSAIFSQIDKVLNYASHDRAKTWEAIQAPGSIQSSIFGRQIPEGNKRLAQVGDAVLRLLLVNNSYAGDEYRGSTQNHVSRIASNANLATVGRLHGIDEFINPAAGTIAISNGTVADTVEALIGAVFLDGGVSGAEKAVVALGLM